MLRLAAIMSLVATQNTAAQCTGLADMLATLGGQFQESPISQGETSEGVTVQMWGNPDTGTWSIITLHSNGVACLVASGQAFSWQPPKPNV